MYHNSHWFTSLSTLARYAKPGLNFGFENSYSSLLSGSASFLCAALTSPLRARQFCPQTEYHIDIHVKRKLQDNDYLLDCIPLLYSLEVACDGDTRL